MAIPTNAFKTLSYKDNGQWVELESGRVSISSYQSLLKRRGNVRLDHYNATFHGAGLYTETRKSDGEEFQTVIQWDINCGICGSSNVKATVLSVDDGITTIVACRDCEKRIFHAK